METHLLQLDADPRAQGLIFDLDGTLADTMPTHFQAWSQLADENGFLFPHEVFLELAGVPTFDIIEIMNERQGMAMDPQALTDRKEELFLSFLGDIQVIEPVWAVLEKYHGKLPIGCGTGGIREVAMHILDNLKLRSYFDAIVTADDVTRHKPAPDTFLFCAKQMGVDPSVCQVFEDGVPGLQAAEAAGMIATDIRPFLNPG